MRKRVLLTGIAGFIGFHLAKLLLSKGYQVIGLDNLNDYYEVELKYNRLKQLGINVTEKEAKNSTNELLSFYKCDLENQNEISKIFELTQPEVVINLAAQAGVRYSLVNPTAYLKSNCEGFLNILEGCRNHKVEHLLYASTSSVYGLNTEMPLRENMSTDYPVSFYAATKKSNEIFAHSYSNMFQVPTTGLRFFTVYGPWGRPDMALFLFTKAILENRPINVFNYGDMIRDFTYVDDIVHSIEKLIPKAPGTIEDRNFKIGEQNSNHYQILNIGNSKPTQLMEYIRAIEDELKKKALINFMEIQKGDVPITHAASDRLFSLINFRPRTTVNEGVKNFVDWYKKYYSI